MVVLCLWERVKDKECKQAARYVKRKGRQGDFNSTKRFQSERYLDLDVLDEI